MKQLVAVFCTILFTHTMGQSPMDMQANAAKTSGEKVLLKALTAIVNRENTKKAPIKTPELFSSESPLS